VVGSLPRVRVFAGARQAAGRTGADLGGKRSGRDRVICVHDPPVLLAGVKSQIICKYGLLRAN
jgi:hypothetical protein